MNFDSSIGLASLNEAGSVAYVVGSKKGWTATLGFGDPWEVLRAEFTDLTAADTSFAPDGSDREALCSKRDDSVDHG